MVHQFFWRFERTRLMSIPASESCASSESPAYCELSRPFGSSDAWDVFFWETFGGKGRGSTWGGVSLQGFFYSGDWIFYVDSRKGGCKATWYPSSKTLRFGCQDCPVTGNANGWSLPLASFLLDWLAACHLKPSRGFVGALRTLVSSLVDTLHLGSKSSKLVMFHVTLPTPPWKSGMENHEKSGSLSFGPWFFSSLSSTLQEQNPFGCGSWVNILIIMSIESGDLSRYQEQ